MADESTLRRLPRVPPEIRKRYDLPCTYGWLHKRVLDGIIPSERVGGKIYVDESSYHDIASELRRCIDRRRAG